MSTEDARAAFQDNINRLDQKSGGDAQTMTVAERLQLNLARGLLAMTESIREMELNQSLQLQRLEQLIQRVTDHRSPPHG